LTLEFLVSTGKKFIPVTHNDTIMEFLGQVPQDKLPYSPMSPEAQLNLAERGRRYAKLSLGSHYMSYQSDSFLLHMRKKPNNPAGYGQQGLQNVGASSFLRSSGRVMLDGDVGRRLSHFPSEGLHAPGSTLQQSIVTFMNQEQQQQNQMHNNLFGAQYINYGRHSSVKSFAEVPEELLAFCWPAITGFSFTAKAWGHVVLEGLSEIKYDDRAFDQLVLEEARKELIKAIVKHSEAVFKDIISGKGGGSIFLLHGPPGTGKTLTAEAVAEMLHRPMYTVSMGELGTAPEHLESNLSDILELATVWNALVLIDEAVSLSC